MQGKVVHCKRAKYDIYIGRPGPWGNPFIVRKESERGKVIDMYRQWLEGQIKSGAIAKKDILSLRGKALGCWCSPKACHGEVLLEKAEEIFKEQNSSQAN